LGSYNNCQKGLTGASWSTAEGEVALSYCLNILPLSEGFGANFLATPGSGGYLAVNLAGLPDGGYPKQGER